MPLENPFSFLRLQARKRKKRFLGTPQTPAGRTLHPLGKGVALKLMPMGDTPIGINLSGSKGRCPLKTPSLSRLEPKAPSEKEKKRGIWGHPKPRPGDPCTPWGGVLPLS